MFELTAGVINHVQSSQQDNSLPSQINFPARLLSPLGDKKKWMELAHHPVTTAINTARNGKVIQLQAWIDFTGSRRLRIADFKTIGA